MNPPTAKAMTMTGIKKPRMIANSCEPSSFSVVLPMVAWGVLGGVVVVEVVEEDGILVGVVEEDGIRVGVVKVVVVIVVVVEVELIVSVLGSYDMGKSVVVSVVIEIQLKGDEK